MSGICKHRFSFFYNFYTYINEDGMGPSLVKGTKMFNVISAFITALTACALVGAPVNVSDYQYMRLEIETSYTENAYLECERTGENEWTCVYTQVLEEEEEAQFEGRDGEYTTRHYVRTDVQRVVVDDAGMQELIDQLHDGTIDNVVDMTYTLRE